MPRLIDADALERIVEEKFHEHYGNTVYQFIHDFFRFVIRQIRKAPTIDPESLRPHGRWEFFDFASPTVECSICGALAGWNVAEEYHCDRTNFCPNCGAKMDDEE